VGEKGKCIDLSGNSERWARAARIRPGQEFECDQLLGKALFIPGSPRSRQGLPPTATSVFPFVAGMMGR